MSLLILSLSTDLSSGDLGILEGPDNLISHTPNSTWLTHWGLYKDQKVGGWRKAHTPGQVRKGVDRCGWVWTYLDSCGELVLECVWTAREIVII